MFLLPAGINRRPLDHFTNQGPPMAALMYDRDKCCLGSTALQSSPYLSFGRLTLLVLQLNYRTRFLPMGHSRSINERPHVVSFLLFFPLTIIIGGLVDQTHLFQFGTVVAVVGACCHRCLESKPQHLFRTRDPGAAFSDTFAGLARKLLKERHWAKDRRAWEEGRGFDCS